MSETKTSVRERAEGLFAPIPAVFDGKGEPDRSRVERRSSPDAA